jgi:hypothetical protein
MLQVVELLSGSTSRVALLHGVVLEALTSHGAPDGVIASTEADKDADKQVQAAMDLFATKNCFTFPQ